MTDQPAPVVHHHSLEPILFWVGEQHYLLENSAVDLDSLEFDRVENVAFAISFKQFFEVVQLELIVLISMSGSFSWGGKPSVSRELSSCFRPYG